MLPASIRGGMTVAPVFTEAELEAYLDEALPLEATVEIERALREGAELRERLLAIQQRCDAGLHSLSAIWRRHRLTCPTRDQLGSYLLGALDGELAEFIQFHLETSGCRVCQANWLDLKSRQSEVPQTTDRRRKKYFESSAGHLPRARA